MEDAATGPPPRPPSDAEREDSDPQLVQDEAPPVADGKESVSDSALVARRRGSGDAEEPTLRRESTREMGDESGLKTDDVEGGTEGRFESSTEQADQKAWHEDGKATACEKDAAEVKRGEADVSQSEEEFGWKGDSSSSAQRRNVSAIESSNKDTFFGMHGTVFQGGIRDEKLDDGEDDAAADQSHARSQRPLSSEEVSGALAMGDGNAVAVEETEPPERRSPFSRDRELGANFASPGGGHGVELPPTPQLPPFPDEGRESRSHNPERRRDEGEDRGGEDGVSYFGGGAQYGCARPFRWWEVAGRTRPSPSRRSSLPTQLRRHRGE